MTFWLISLGVTLLAALIAFYPILLGKLPQKDKGKRNQLNKAFYFNRLDELKEDEAQGVIENSAQLEKELQHNLLQDIPESEKEIKAENKYYSRIWFISGFLSFVIIASMCYLPIGSWHQEALLDNVYHELPKFYQRLDEQDAKPLDTKEMSDFALALRVKLQKEPNNAGDWWMLGQVAMAQNDARLAFDSYAKAYKLEPNNLGYKLSYAKLLLFTDNKIDKMQGLEYLREILRVDHSNVQALSLLAFYHFEQADYKRAASTWEMILKLIPKDDPRVGIIEKSIQRANAIVEQEGQFKQSQKKLN